MKSNSIEMRSNLQICEEIAQALDNQYYMNNSIKICREENDNILINVNQKMLENIQLKSAIEQIKRKIPKNIIQLWKSPRGLLSKMTCLRNLKNLLQAQCQKQNEQYRHKRRQLQTQTQQRQEDQAELSEKQQLLKQKQDSLYRVRQKNNNQEQMLRQLVQSKDQMKESINNINFKTREHYFRNDHQECYGQNMVYEQGENSRQYLIGLLKHFSSRKEDLLGKFNQLSNLHKDLNKEIQAYQEQRKERAFRKDGLIQMYEQKKTLMNSISQLKEKTTHLQKNQRILADIQVQKRIQQRSSKYIPLLRRYNDLQRRILKLVLKATVTSQVHHVQKIITQQRQ